MLDWQDPVSHLGLVRIVVQREIATKRHLWPERADLEQQGFEGVLRAFKTYNPEKGRFSTYAAFWVRHFVQTAINQAQSVTRPNAQHRKSAPPPVTHLQSWAPPAEEGGTPDDATVEGTLASRGTDPECFVERAQLVKMIMDGLEKLTPLQATIVRRIHLEGVKCSEVAGELGIKVKAVENALFRAMQILRGEMAEQVNGWEAETGVRTLSHADQKRLRRVG